MTTASDVARYIVGFFQEAGDPVTNLKLQKLLYYVQGWCLALTGSAAFDDRFEAWVHGPVQPGVYGEYKRNRWHPICDVVSRPEIEGVLVDVIGEVLEAYGGETGYQLEMRTHLESPWIEARGGIPADQESTKEISKASMERYFRGLLDEQETHCP